MNVRFRKRIKEVLLLFRRENLDQRNRDVISDGGFSLASAIINRDIPALRSFIQEVCPSTKFDAVNSTPNPFGLGAFYWFTSVLTGKFITHFKEEEDACFLLSYCIENDLLPLLTLMENDRPYLNDLLEKIKNDRKLMDKLTIKGYEPHTLVGTLIQCGVLEKLFEGNCRVGLSLRGKRLLTQLRWLSDFKEPERLIMALLGRKAIHNHFLPR